METAEPLTTVINQVQQKLNEAMNTLTRQPVQLSLKQGGVTDIPSLHKSLGSNQAATSVYIPIVGDVKGDIFLFLYKNSGHILADTMLGNAPGTTVNLGDLELSALKEIGNITSGVIVTCLANTLKLSMMLTIPNLATDFASALVDNVLIDYGSSSNNLLAIDLPFEINEIQSSGSFLILFDELSSQTMKTKFNQPTGESHV